MKWLAILAALTLGGTSAAAQIVGNEKQIVPMVKSNWIAFWDYEGRQWIYFTQLVTYRCGLSEIRYSLNTADLDQTFPLPECDPENPNAIDPVNDPPYLRLPLGSADTLTVQVVYKDGEAGEPATFRPCATSDQHACGVLVE